MPKVKNSELSEYQRLTKSQTQEELRIVLPKEVIADIRKVAKVTKTPVATLFEEMATAIAAGTLRQPKSK